MGTDSSDTPTEKAAAALARAIADDLYAASTTGDVIDMLVKGEYETWREHVERIGSIAAESTPAAVRALLSGDWLERALGEHWAQSARANDDGTKTVVCGCGHVLADHALLTVPVAKALRAHQAAAVRTAAFGEVGA